MLSGFTGWHALVLLVIVVLLFGARRLPDVARSVGQSLKIFKSEIKDLTSADATTASAPPTASPAPAPAPVSTPDPLPEPAPAGQTTPSEPPSSTAPSDPSARPPSPPTPAADTDPLPPAGAGAQV